MEGCGTFCIVFTEAAELYSKAAEKGDAQAQVCLGVMYANGQGVHASDTDALMWLEKAAKQGRLDAVHTITLIHGRSAEGYNENNKAMTPKCGRSSGSKGDTDRRSRVRLSSKGKSIGTSCRKQSAPEIKTDKSSRSFHKERGEKRTYGKKSEKNRNGIFSRGHRSPESGAGTGTRF